MDKSPVRLASVADLSSFSFWTRSAIGEHMRFATRTVCQNTDPGTRQSVAFKDIPFLIHSYVRLDGLSGVVVSDSEYPHRVAHTLIQTILQQFELNNNKWANVLEDQNVEPESMKTDLLKFQDPSEDKLFKIQKNLDEIKEVMQTNIDVVLSRGVSLDVLMAKSEDLSNTSYQFYKKAKKTNQCCKAY